MLAYRITEINSRIVVGTEDGPILVCTSLEVAAPGGRRREAPGDAARQADFFVAGSASAAKER